MALYYWKDDIAILIYGNILMKIDLLIIRMIPYGILWYVNPNSIWGQFCVSQLFIGILSLSWHINVISCISIACIMRITDYRETSCLMYVLF